MNSSRLKCIIYAGLMNYHIFIIENTQAQFDNLRGSSGKKLYTSVLNNDDTIMHQVCRYKYLVYCYIRWTYTGFCQNNEMEKKQKLTDLNGHFSLQSIVVFIVKYDLIWRRLAQFVF